MKVKVITYLATFDLTNRREGEQVTIQDTKTGLKWKFVVKTTKDKAFKFLYSYDKRSSQLLRENKESSFIEVRGTSRTERRMYLVDGCRVPDNWNNYAVSDEDFMAESERQGLVYSLEGFAKAFNNTREINPIKQHIRIL